MKFNRTILCGLLCIAVLPLMAWPSGKSGEMPVRHYYRMLDSLKTGWNTWDTRSMFTQLYLPEAFSIKVALVDSKGEVASDLRAGNPRRDAAYVHPRDHVWDNSYSEVDATWHGVSVKLRSASDGDRHGSDKLDLGCIFILYTLVVRCNDFNFVSCS